MYASNILDKTICIGIKCANIQKLITQHQSIYNLHLHLDFVLVPELYKENNLIQIKYSIPQHQGDRCAQFSRCISRNHADIFLHCRDFSLLMRGIRFPVAIRPTAFDCDSLHLSLYTTQDCFNHRWTDIFSLKS